MNFLVKLQYSEEYLSRIFLVVADGEEDARDAIMRAKLRALQSRVESKQVDPYCVSCVIEQIPNVYELNTVDYMRGGR